MAKTAEAEIAEIEEAFTRLIQRKKAAQGKLREAAIQTVDKAGLLKLPPARLESLMTAVKALGIDEVEKRLLTSE